MTQPQQYSMPGSMGNAAIAPAAAPLQARAAAVRPGFVISYSPVRMAQRAANFRKLCQRHWISFGISAVISILFWLLWRPEVGSFFFWLLVLGPVVSLIQIIVAFVRLKLARKVTAQIPLGPAMQADAEGLVLATNPNGERVRWEDVTSLRGHQRYRNPGPGLKCDWIDPQSGQARSWELPMVEMDAMPGTIDSAIRAYSRGRFGLDLSGVDELW